MVENTGLSDRERLVLRAVVETYVSIGDPIGSRMLSRREDLGISSATIRNTLASLEERGYVRQPHTSAGRVPTDSGYRFFVENAMATGMWDSHVGDKLKERLEVELREQNLDEIVGQLARAIGDISEQLGLVMAPRFEQGVFERLELVQLAADRILLVISIEQGLVRSMTIEIGARISREQLETTNRLLNERLGGLTMAEIRSSVEDRLLSIESGSPQLIRLVAEQIKRLTGPSGSDLYVAGTRNICLKPEFHDPSTVADLMDLVEEKEYLARFLMDRQGVVVTIGDENAPEAMRGCSVVTSSYRVNGAMGIIGVIGPTRMPYEEVVTLVSYAAWRAAGMAN